MPNNAAAVRRVVRGSTACQPTQARIWVGANISGMANSRSTMKWIMNQARRALGTFFEASISDIIFLSRILKTGSNHPVVKFSCFVWKKKGSISSLFQSSLISLNFCADLVVYFFARPFNSSLKITSKIMLTTLTTSAPRNAAPKPATSNPISNWPASQPVR